MNISLQPVRATLALFLVSSLPVGCASSPEGCVVAVAPDGQSAGSFDGLQAALDATAPGSVLTVCATPPAESVTVRRAVEVRGVSGSRLQGLYGAPTLLIEPTGGGVVVLRDIEIAAPQASTFAALVVRGIARLERVTVAGADGAALSLQAAMVTVAGSVVSAAGGRGIDAVGGVVSLDDVEIAGAGDDGIHTEGTQLLAIDLTVSAAGGDGLEVIGGSLDLERAAVSGCEGHGLALTSSEGALRDVSVDAVKGSGVVSTRSELEVSSLLLRGSDRNGLEVLGGNVHVDDLESEKHGKNGVLLGADAYLSCSACVLVGGIEGVRVSGGSLLHLTASEARGAVGRGISVRDDSLAWLTDTTIEGAGTGILLNDEYCQLTATRVIVEGSAGVGVLVKAGTLTFLQGSVSGSGSDGLRVTGGTVTVSDSSFEKSALNGISLAGQTHAQVKATTLANGEWGLLCDGGAEGAAASSVVLSICDLVAGGNGAGSVSLIHGCQQGQFCTEKQP